MSTAFDKQTGQARVEIALDWHARLNDDIVSLEERRAFFEWLKADEANPDAFAHAQQFLDSVSALDATRVADIRRAQATKNQGARLGLRRWQGLVACTLLFVVSAILVTLNEPSTTTSTPVSTSYVTDIGGLQEITLSDGSMISLGADSHLDASLSADTRHVILHRGVALFRVSPDADRPFYVKARDMRVQVVGTRFEVKLTPEKAQVAVAEGLVQVGIENKQSGSGAVEDSGLVEPARSLSAGQQIRISARALGDVVTVSTASIGAWRRNRLIYENAPLADVIADANRYDKRDLSILDDRLKALSVTATFNAADIDRMLAALSEVYPVEIEVDDDRIIIKPR
ncbi:MAG: FecR domain-containing protein [Pseudomonadota bacterium]